MRFTGCSTIVLSGLYCLAICESGPVAAQETEKAAATRRPMTEAPFNQGGIITLAIRPVVLKELGIERDCQQFNDLSQLAERVKDEFFKKIAERTPGNRLGSDAIEEQVVAMYLPDLQKVLKPEQFLRLQQINRQWRKNGALQTKEVAEALELSDEQKSQLSKAQRDHLRALISMETSSGVLKTATRAEYEKLRQANDETWAKRINEILTPRQQEQYAELKGKPFDFTGETAGGRRRRLAIRAPLEVRPNGLMGLALSEPPVLKELGISPNGPEIAPMRSLALEMLEITRERHRNPVGDEVQDRKRISLNVQNELNPRLQQILTAPQFQRLREIQWQISGPRAVLDPEVVKELNLTPEQLMPLREHERNWFRKMAAITNPREGLEEGDRESVMRKLGEIQGEFDQKINEVLTPEQQKKLAELKGKPFDLSLIGR